MSPPGRLLRHDGDRRPLHDAEQLPLLAASCSTSARTQEVPFLYASSAAVYGARPRVPRGARIRGAAQRLRLFQVPVRPVRARACWRERSAQVVGFRYFNVYGAARAAQGAHGVGGVPLLQPVSARAARSSSSRAAAATATASSGAISCPSTTWSRVNLWFLDHPRQSGIFNLRHRARAELQRRCRRDGQRLPPARRRAAACAGGHAAPGRDRIHPVPDGARGQVPELHPGRHVARCARPAMPRPFMTVEQGVAALC